LKKLFEKKSKILTKKLRNVLKNGVCHRQILTGPPV
jgi:hypothetical protein